MPSETKSLRLFHLIAPATLALALLWLYWPVLIGLIERVSADEDFSYGLLLPLVSGYIVYLKWPKLRSQPWQPSWWGLAVMALGLGLYIVGKLAADLYSPPFSFIVALTGGLLLMGGWRIVRFLAFPLLLLLLMIPLPSMFTNSLTLPLQLISSQLAATILQAIGIPLVRQGNVIDLGSRQLQVVAACSGLRYVLSLTALGIIFCYFYQRRLWKVAILILSLIPAAIVANALRVAAMGIFPVLQPEGFWHSFSGWLIFIFCFGFLSLFNSGLNYLSPSGTAGGSMDKEEEAKKETNISSYTHLIAALFLIAVATPLVYGINMIAPVPLLQSFDNFPQQLSSWQGRRNFLDPEIIKATDSSAYLDAQYTTPGEVPVSLYIAYYESRATAGALGHNPKACMTGGGWETKASGSDELGPGLPVNYLLLEREGVHLLVYYWHIQQGNWVAASVGTNKLYIIYNGILNRRTDWAMVRLITPVEGSVEPARKRLASFGNLIVPVLPKFIRP